MNKYTLTIEGDFEKGECRKCPISKKYACVGEDSFFDTYLGCTFKEIEDCPLEKVRICHVCGSKVEYDIVTKYDFCQNCGTDVR